MSSKSGRSSCAALPALAKCLRAANAAMGQPCRGTSPCWLLAATLATGTGSLSPCSHLLYPLLAACLSGLPSRDPAWQRRLETDIQNLEQHLEAMRATYQLNQEKLEYNFRVLTERDAENQATINQQKRKISRQRDVLSVMMVGVAGSMAGHVRMLCLLMVLLLPAAWQVAARMSAGS